MDWLWKKSVWYLKVTSSGFLLFPNLSHLKQSVDKHNCGNDNIQLVVIHMKKRSFFHCFPDAQVSFCWFLNQKYERKIRHWRVCGRITFVLWDVVVCCRFDLLQVAPGSENGTVIVRAPRVSHQPYGGTALKVTDLPCFIFCHSRPSIFCRLGFRTFKINFFFKKTRIAHLCHSKSFVMIKLREVMIWADQTYLVSLHVLLGFFSATPCLF